LTRRPPDLPDGVEGVVFSPDGSQLVAASRDGAVRGYATPGYLPVFDTTSLGGGLPWPFRLMADTSPMAKATGR